MSNTDGTRLIYLDDTHPLMTYEGSWTIDSELHDDLDHRVNNGSQHRTTGTASMTFEFMGQQLVIVGTIRSRTTASGELVLPNYRCTVDGDEMWKPEHSVAISVNRFEHCTTRDVILPPDVRHTFRLEVEATEEAPFWLDFVFLRPTRAPSTHLEFTNYWTQLRNDDASLRYSSGWEELADPTSMFTNTPGSRVDLQFIGTKLTWIGRLLANQSATPSTATYTLNGGDPVEVALRGRVSERDPGEYVLFETLTLPRTRHNLSVVYSGDAGAPLVMHFLLVPDGDMFERDPGSLGSELDGRVFETTPSTTTSGPPSSSGSTSRLENSAGQTAPVGAIVGGVVGGVAFLLLLVLAGVFFYKRRGKRRNEKGGVNEVRTEHSVTTGSSLLPSTYPISQTSPSVSSRPLIDSAPANS